MRKQRLLWATIMAFTLLGVTGCDKNDDPDPVPPKTKTELITASSWRFSSATVGGTDVSSSLQACQKDNTILFAAAGTGTLDEGAAKCNAGDPQTSPYTWNFLAGETQLFISATLFTGGSSTFTLVTLSETTLVLSQAIVVLGSPQTAVVTFVH